MTLFAQKAALTKAYIEAKYDNTSADGWHKVMLQAINVMRACAREEWAMRDKHKTGGAFLNSQLDLISKWHGEADAVRQSAYNAKLAV
jgi:hypothetical protein